MSRLDDPAFREWVQEAEKVDILDAFRLAPRSKSVKLTRAGKEWVGPCPNCAGKDRFAINMAKQVFVCRGAAGGGAINMVMHIEQCSFTEAVETITGRGKPGRTPLTEKEKIARRELLERLDAETAERRRQQDEEDRADRAKRTETAAAIWRSTTVLAGTLAEAYMIGRGIDTRYFTDGNIRFHPMLWHEIARASFPALVARVQGADGKGIGIWRIYLGSGRKGRAPVDAPKIGKGAFADRGGAVRLGGMAETIGLGEGIETAAAARELSAVDGGDMPVWSALTAGGIASFIVPARIKRVIVFGDADLSKWDPRTGSWGTPAGVRAVHELQRRYAGTDIEIVDGTPQTSSGKLDYVDLLRKWKGLPDEE